MKKAFFTLLLITFSVHAMEQYDDNVALKQLARLFGQIIKAAEEHPELSKVIAAQALMEALNKAQSAEEVTAILDQKNQTGSSLVAKIQKLFREHPALCAHPMPAPQSLAVKIQQSIEQEQAEVFTQIAESPLLRDMFQLPTAFLRQNSSDRLTPTSATTRADSPYPHKLDRSPDSQHRSNSNSPRGTLIEECQKTK